MKRRSRKDKYTYMTQTPVEQLIRELSLPTIISMLVTGIYNTADTFFVGRISTQATAAVGVVFSVMALIQAVGFFCGHGSGNYMSRQMGAGNIREANEMAATGFALAVILGVVIAVTGNIFGASIAQTLGATPTILHDTLRYMRVILVGAPVMMSQLVINNQLRFEGSAIYAMFGLVSGSILNIGLDPLFIFVFHMGVTGAAVATVLSQCVSFAILWIGSHRGENIRLEAANIRMNRHYLLEIVNGGLPSLLRQGLSSISTIVMNRTAGAMGGDAAIAGMSVVTRVMMLAYSGVIGFGQGFQPLCSFNYGARLYDRVKKGYWFCVRYATMFLFVMSGVFLLFAPHVIGVFRDDPAVIAVGTVALRFQASSFYLMGFVTLTNMMLQSMGKGVRGSIIAAARTGLFFLPAILILPRLFGLRGVQMAQMCADICAFFLCIPFAYSVLKEMKEEAP